MGAIQIFAVVVSLVVTAVAVTMTTMAVRSIVATVKVGQPTSGRTDQPVRRTITMVKETFLHTRMLQWHWVGIMHWFVYAAFILLSTAVMTGYVQLFKPDFALPIIGHFFLFEWASEGLGLLGTIGIVFLIVYRQLHHPRREGRRSRFYGSNQWQAYFVEAMALLEGSAILFIRGAEYNLGQIASDHPEDFSTFHFPISSHVGTALFPTGAGSEGTLENIIVVIAMIKILLAMVWLIVISSNLNMGVAWHRFTAWPNIWFKREGSGRTALGALKPLTSDGKPITLDDIDDLDEDSTLGVGKIEDFSWKGILDFTTCTECGRCQSQCPAWNTEKPLSPKLLIMGLRDHAYAKGPYSRAGGEESEAATALLEGNEVLQREAERPLVGDTGDDWFYMPENGAAVIDPDVLWSCTSCGACVQQCPVDIEHVDHIVDMRRYQVLVESNFPAELNGLFKRLESKGNPWGMSPNDRLDWAKGLDFEVPVVGETIESLDEVDWLFWVGCAGAYEDRAKKTTRATAELLDMAGISFGVLGNGETCTGDSARRAGNEFVFQGLAAQNVETLKEFKAKKVVSTCPHCMNTLKNEYKSFGIELEVIHHTQLLNRLVRDGKLTPVASGAGAHQRTITYHDPCYLGRHNQVYTPPRELLQIMPGAEVKEMERNSERSFCCGAGGARMWMEENIGERINVNRTQEAVGTGADQIAVGCPFCRVMISDGLTAEQSGGRAREEVEVLDVAQMLLASVKGEQATKLLPGEGAKAAPAKAKPAAKKKDEALEAEPEDGDVTVTDSTVTETADVGPLAKASGGDSLFDTPESKKEEPKKEGTGGSLFDDDASSLFDTPAKPAAKAEPAEKPAAEKPAEKPAADLGAGGSLFDLGGDAPAKPAAKAEPAEKPAEKPAAEKPAEKPAADLGAGGSLFDIPAQESAPAAPAVPAESKAEPVEAKAEPAATGGGATSSPRTDVDISAAGSLFDIAAPETGTAPARAAEPDATESAATEPAATEPEPAPVAEKPAATGGGATSSPRTDVDISAAGSLFDIAAPETGTAPARAEERAPVTEEPAPVTEEPAPVTEEPAPVTEGPVAEEPEAEAPVSEPEPEPAPATSVAPAASGGGATSTPRTDVDIHATSSLFDIEAPETGTAPAPATPAPAAETPVAEAEPEAAAEPEPEPEPEAVAEPEPAPAPQEKPRSSGATHTPRTDADIHGADSLFDL
ncbi:(Fe-S)-binding protein [Nocardioides zeae]|uniref:4Fe-4S dicluster domain-containing protein n=1 Tax=Nocardioides zeae TaxID=1457234 RepID=A0A6P0HLS6_9ACTN|nr:(Fe-S)-binding protein [Nocardioides zeae]NEN79204.1 4Fe-4S dicluster domain-containing protein [Nocardioides zeae]